MDLGSESDAMSVRSTDSRRGEPSSPFVPVRQPTLFPTTVQSQQSSAAASQTFSFMSQNQQQGNLPAFAQATGSAGIYLTRSYIYLCVNMIILCPSYPRPTLKSQNLSPGNKNRSPRLINNNKLKIINILYFNKQKDYYQ